MKTPKKLLSFLCSCLYFASVNSFCAIEEVLVQSESYLESLISQSKVKGLAQKRTWHLLLHYRGNTLDSGFTSEVDGADFFLAPKGKYDPQAELEATLAAFVMNKKSGEDGQLLQCRFPARYEWLNEQLKFDSSEMLIHECEQIELWRERINAKSISLIFASYYFNNPASMFGHTLLRINSADSTQPSLLDFAITYAADIEGTDNFFDYAWNGIFGGFEGRFTVYPYYDLVKRYNDLENRDLWEYQLNLSAEQVDFMLLHLWELINTHFDFFFLRENCSYHLLSLLEVANPELNFRDEYLVWTLPSDTIKQVSKTPELVEGVIRRPSLRSQLELQLRGLNRREKGLVNTLLHDHQLKDYEELAGIPEVRLAAVIDTAITFSQYLGIANKGLAEEQRNIRHHLMVERSKLNTEIVEFRSPEKDQLVSPDQGHDPIRISILGGSFRYTDDLIETENESFVELTIQPGFHDLLSREDGHASNAQIKFLALTVRFSDEHEEWKVQELSLTDIISLYPVSTFLKEPSWKLKVGWERNQDGSCADCTPFILNPGIGLAFQSNLHNKEVYYGFLEASFEFDHELDSDYRGGYGATAGLLFDATDQWRIALAINRIRYTNGDNRYVTHIGFQQRIYYSRNLEIFFELKEFDQNREGNLGFAYYF